MLQQVRNSDLLSKISTICAYSFFLFTLISLIFLTFITKNFTFLPPTNTIDLIHNKTLAFFITLASTSLKVSIITWILRLLLQTKKWHPPKNLGAWKVILITFLMIIIFSFYVFSRVTDL